MRGNRWGREGPPPEAYSRISEPERFAPLHDAASALLDRLEATFDVTSETGHDLDPMLLREAPARPTRRLTPSDPHAAPITIAFTSFPGLRVRFGRWTLDGYPSCGCDACDEIAPREIERLEWDVGAVTSGGFNEWLKLGRFGNGERGHAFVHTGGAHRGHGMILRQHALELLGGGKPGSIAWKAWPRRVPED